MVEIFHFPENGKPPPVEVTVAKQPSLRPQDLVVTLALALYPEQRFEALAHTVHLGLSEVHRSSNRLSRAQLLLPGKRRIHRAAVLEFLMHGARYAFPAVRGPEAPGIPTAWAAPVLEGVLPQGPPIVWPHADGSVRGESVVPLSEAAPDAARKDPKLYRLLALVDAVRLGQARDRQIAGRLLKKDLAPA